MKKEKKGFTIVELLATVVILAIVITLAVTSYGKVSVNVKQKSFENLKTHIETKAEEYANDTGNLLTNVDQLVKEGYIEADDEDGKCKKPSRWKYTKLSYSKYYSRKREFVWTICRRRRV